MNHVRERATKFFYTALSAALFAYATVVINAYTRVSEARVGCPAWYDCYGRTSDTSGAQELRPSPTYAEAPWEAKVHPFLAAALAIVVLRLAFLGWQWEPQPNRRFVIPLIVFVLLFTVVLPDLKIAVATVPPWASMTQLVGVLTILALLWWLVVREQRFWKSVERSPLTRQLRPRALVALAIIAAVTLLGGWSNVGQAGLPCVEFPTCHGEWWPPMDIANGFSVDRLTGASYAGAALAPSAATAVHMIHRVGALVVVLYVGWLAMHVFSRGVENNLCRYGLWILLLLLAQVSLGIMMVVMRLPVPVALAHSAVSALLLLAMVTLYHCVSPRERVEPKL